MEDKPRTETEFERQERLFLAIPQEQLEQYWGEFVASRDGKIVDHDPMLPTLTQRFFGTFGEGVDVYIVKIGEARREIMLSTPLWRQA